LSPTAKRDAGHQIDLVWIQSQAYFHHHQRPGCDYGEYGVAIGCMAEGNAGIVANHAEGVGLVASIKS
jgi:hypothetical protein